MFGNGFSYWWLIIPPLVLSLWAQFKVMRTFSKYKEVATAKGITGAVAAREILKAYGVNDVPVENVPGELTDHYDPKLRVLRLSESVYNSSSVAALGVAAHEVGHAIQHATSYAPLMLRNNFYPIAALGTNLGPILVIVGIIIGFIKPLIMIGIFLFAFAVFFSLVTLPVEFDASKRAIKVLEGGGMLTAEEVVGAKKVLSAAALTYVAAAVTAILTLIRFILMSRSRD
ncbi:MAG: zinc metallopeptidase [Spirochaetes bacterium]|nr:zinc metallopeptidase [Spirochaetota bacterium]